MGIFKALQKAVWLPVEVVKDVITLGGTCEGEDEPYTIQRLKKIEKELDD